MAYSMAMPPLSHHIDTRSFLLERPQNEQAAQEQQAAASLARVIPFLSASALEHQGFNKVFLKEAEAYTASGSPLTVTAALKTKHAEIPSYCHYYLERPQIGI